MFLWQDPSTRNATSGQNDEVRRPVLRMKEDYTFDFGADEHHRPHIDFPVRTCFRLVSWMMRKSER